MDEIDLDDERPRAKKSSTGIIVAAVVVVTAGAFFGWTLRKGTLLDAPVAAIDAGTPPPFDAGLVAAAAPDAGPPGPKPVPKDGEAILRGLILADNSRAELKSWLATEGLLRRIVAGVSLVADGKSPRPVIDFISIRGEFGVREERAPDRIWMAPGSPSRYDEVTRIIASGNWVSLGRGYAQLRPFFDAIFAEMATPGEKFDDLLKEAIRRLVTVKVPEGPIPLVPKGAVYAFEDPALEALGAPEKHLIRMGPDNARSIQNALRRFAENAGL